MVGGCCASAGPTVNEEASNTKNRCQEPISDAVFCGEGHHAGYLRCSLGVRHNAEERLTKPKWSSQLRCSRLLECGAVFAQLYAGPRLVITGVLGGSIPTGLTL